MDVKEPVTPLDALMFTSAQFVPPSAFYLGPPPPYPGSPPPAHVQEYTNGNFSCNSSILHQQQYHQQQQHIQDHRQQEEQQRNDLHYQNQQQQQQQQQWRQDTVVAESYQYHDPVPNDYLPNQVTFIPNDNPPPYSESIAPDRR